MLWVKAKAYTTREFNKLKRFEIDDDITHLESDLFLAKIKDNFKYKEYIIFYLNIGYEISIFDIIIDFSLFIYIIL